jgi:hypothetical protein
MQKLLKETIIFLQNSNEKDIILSEESFNFFKKDLKEFINRNKINLKNQISKEKPVDTKLEKKEIINSAITSPIKEEIKVDLSIKKEITPIKKQDPIPEIKNTTSLVEHTEKKEEEPLKIKEILKSEFISNEKIDIPKTNFSDVENILKKISNIELTPPINDKVAKEVLNKHKYKDQISPILILAYTEDENSFKFLQKLSIAISNYFRDCKIIKAYDIEKKDSWNSILDKSLIKHIITSDYAIYEMKNLKKYFLENEKKEKYLNEIPLLLLPDISLYLKEPMLKKSLFNMLKKTLINE